MMKTKINHLLLYAFFALLTFTACQNEEVDVNNPDEQEIIDPNSPLATFMNNVTANYGAYDDILDNASCFSIELPVTIIVGDITIVIETLEDIEELEELFDEFEDEEDFFEFVFPITIIFNDYTEIVIENIDQLEAIIEECEFDEEDDDIIECIDFVYPITFSIFDATFDIVDTVTIENDEALYNFLDELEDDENTLIVSLNYPVTLVYANGETITVDSNQELADAIAAAEEDCDDDDDQEDCDEEHVIELLLQCPWDIEDEYNDFEIYQIIFYEDGSLAITEGDTTSAIGGEWSITNTDEGLVLNLFELTAFEQDLGGEWLIVDCDDEELEIVRENYPLELDQNCDDDEDDEVFDCFEDFELVACLGPNNEAEFNLSANTIGLLDCPYDFIASFHETEADAEANVNAIAETESYWSSGGEVYLRIESSTGNFEIFTIYLITEECNNFDCFTSFDAELQQCDNGTDGPYFFDLTVAFANCTPSADVVTYHETIADAETGTNPIASPESYAMVGLEALVYVRVVIGEQFEVFPILLYIEDCNEGDCTELDVDGFLTECIWIPVNYNGSDNLMEWNLDFQPNSQSVIIYNNETEIEANWTTSQSEDGVIVTFTNVAGPNIQAITGEWLVVECQEDRLQMHRGDDILVLERECD